MGGKKWVKKRGQKDWAAKGRNRNSKGYLQNIRARG
jgi:hypothetical protein